MTIVTIDGPTASGKSSLARMLAKQLGYYYICSGFLYRALAYILVKKYGYTENKMDTLEPEDIAHCFDLNVFEYRYDETDRERIFYQQEDITPYLKDSFIDKITSIASGNIHVRHFVHVLQHQIAANHDIVIDGRDVGSVVFPHAQVKFYLTASVEIRAGRWMADQNKSGHNYSLQEAIEKVAARDERDRKRAIAPLIIPEGAIVVDNSSYTMEETFKVMFEAVKKALQ